MKKYTKPEMEFARFECEDIMSLSGIVTTEPATAEGSTGVTVVNVAGANTTATAAASPFDPLS